LSLADLLLQTRRYRRRRPAAYALFPSHDFARLGEHRRRRLVEIGGRLRGLLAGHELDVDAGFSASARNSLSATAAAITLRSAATIGAGVPAAANGRPERP
jgi:hypothetical protein